MLSGISESINRPSEIWVILREGTQVIGIKYCIPTVGYKNPVFCFFVLLWFIFYNSILSYRFHLQVYQPLLVTPIAPADWRLTDWSREVSKPRDWGLDFSNRSEIWQAPRQKCSRDACHISELYDYHNIQSRGSETSWDLTMTRLFA